MNSHGLSIKEQAVFLCALCRYSNNPESCPQQLMSDLEECPFNTNIKCEDLPQWAWLPILEKRVIPKDANEYMNSTGPLFIEKITEKIDWTARHCGCPKVLYGTCMHPEDAEACFGETHDPVQCTRNFFINDSAR